MWSSKNGIRISFKIIKVVDVSFRSGCWNSYNLKTVIKQIILTIICDSSLSQKPYVHALKPATSFRMVDLTMKQKTGQSTEVIWTYDVKQKLY